MVIFSGTVQSDYLKYLPGRLDDRTKVLDYSAADFETFRQTLIKYVKANFPLDYNNFQESDFGILLIELMSAIGHIQSHKADYIANENFIRTARERSSVKKLLELIGVRMKGPTSAVADALLTFTTTNNNTTSLTLSPSQRVVTIPSPEDGGQLTYTIYKVNSNGTVDLDSNSHSVEFTFDAAPTGSSIEITNAVLMEGAFVNETGTFQSVDAVKTIRLSESPYIEKSAQVFVEGNPTTAGVYKEEENVYYASGSQDKVFQIVTDSNFAASILFGDDTVGKSPSLGDSFNVTYRVGGGSRGNVANGYINAVLNGTATHDLGQSPVQVSVQNSSIATGGADAESISKAKRYAPLVFRTQNRLVTLSDYKAFCNSFTSNYGTTGKATASVRRAYSSANIIDIFVLEKASDLQLKRATQEYKRQLLEAMDDKKMLTDEPVVVDGLIRTLDVFVTITLDVEKKTSEPEIISSAREILLSYFNVDNTDFGEPFIPQDLIRVLLEDQRIRYATVDNVEGPISIGFNEVIQLNNFTITTAYI